MAQAKFYAKAEISQQVRGWRQRKTGEGKERPREKEVKLLIFPQISDEEKLVHSKQGVNFGKRFWAFEWEWNAGRISQRMRLPSDQRGTS